MKKLKSTTGVNGTIKGKFPFLAGKCRLGLLPQHVKFPSLARTLPSKQSGELFARGKVGMGLFPARGNHTATVKASSLRGRIEVGANPVRGKRAAFTLAEVLITLAVIGVVAAMTLPTLIARINEKADSNQKAVIEAKLIQGLNMLDLH
ncbi:type II secretion system protein, partial [bacterium]|nr:type II secretion system protein [bacterium]